MNEFIDIGRIYKTKEETHSPTVSTEAMFITAIFDALERRDVAVVDIPGAFMQADIDELIHVKLEGELVDLLVEIDPSYSSYITYENGRKILYTQLDKALYGTMQAALLFWKKLSGFLINKLGFTIPLFTFDQFLRLKFRLPDRLRGEKRPSARVIRHVASLFICCKC